MNKIERLINNPWEAIRVLGAKGALWWIPDKEYLQIMFRAKMGEKLDLKNPQTFNEKIQWLKLYDRRELYTKIVDKYLVREYIAKMIGEEYLIPLLGVWDNPQDIEFDKLPEQFVLKCNHDSGTVIICKEKKALNIEETKNYLQKKLKRNFYRGGREWPYKNIKPRIICEKYMENSKGSSLTDYKIYCFGGVPKMVMVASDRFSKKQTHFDYFDRSFKWLDIEWGNPRSGKPPEKPENFEKMIALAEKLSAGIPEVRVDLYEVNGNIFFGELTLFDGSGFQRISPKEWDYRLGSWIELPQ